MNTNRGVIEKLTDKGFGFIKVEGMEKAVFFHASKLRGVKFDELRTGDEVTFDDIENDVKGTKAVGVQLA